MPMFNMRGARRPMQPETAGGVIDPQPAQPQGIFGQAFGGLGRFNERNPMMLAALGRVISGDDPYPVIQAGMAMKKDRKAEQKTAAQENATKALAKRMGFSDDEIEAYAAAGRLGDLLKPKGADDYISAGDGRLFNKDTGEWVIAPPGPEGQTEFGLHPQTGVDANGNPVLIQLGKNGVGVQTKLPDGVTLSKEPIKLDAGTHFVLLDPITRQPIGQIPKENYQAAFDTAQGTVAGKGAGEATDLLASMRSKMPGLEKVVAKLDDLSGKATYTMTGQGIDWANKQLGLEPREAAIARADYIATVDNQVLPLLRDTFGAAFTQKEGDSLRATLGDPDKSPAEKQAVLKAFIEQKRRDVEALESRTGQGSQVPPPAGANQRLRFNPETGELE